jgi:hypothetical protein
MMMKSSVVVAALLASTGTGHGGDALRIAVSPAMSFAPTTLNIQARLVPSADNRVLELVAECADFYRSSEVPLAGENAPTTIAVQFRGVPGGEYRVYAILKDSRGSQRAAAEQRVKVVGDEIPR